MQTDFTLAQLNDPDIAASNDILRKCVHCGFCTATCPTYVLKGDELDSPRGRIYLMKQAFESGAPATLEAMANLAHNVSINHTRYVWALQHQQLSHFLDLDSVFWNIFIIHGDDNVRHL